MVRYGMVIDLNKCVRCRSCYVRCKIVNDIPARGPDSPVEYYRLRYVEWEEGTYPNIRKIFIPVHCMHCDEPACMAVCPAKAITKRPDGIVTVDRTKCIGCMSCTIACPYGAPYILDTRADRCDFCLKLLEQGQQPYCVETCPAGAIVFGDLDDPKSEVSKLVASGKAKPLCPEFGTKPKVYYIPPARYEEEWDKLSTNKKFLQALAKRKKDLPTPATQVVTREVTKYVCPFCGQEFNSSEALAEHIKANHSGLITREVTKEVTKEVPPSPLVAAGALVAGAVIGSAATYFATREKKKEEESKEQKQ